MLTKARREMEFSTASLPVQSGPNAEAWSRARRRLRAELGEEVFSSWFGRLELDGVEDATAFLSVPTKFLQSWIQSHYAEKILTALAAELSGVVALKIAQRSAGRWAGRKGANGCEGAPFSRAMRDGGCEATEPFVAAPPARSTAASEAIEGLTGSPLDRRLTFATFLVGRSNQLAHAAAERVVGAKTSDQLHFNPLYIHAAVGLGKTHLLQAIAHAAPGQKRRVIYLTAEKFMYGFVSALKAQTAIAFKEKLRAIDILIIDDIQFLQGKSIQTEFCHTLNALIDAGRQIVIAADRPPSELESLEERVRSRLAGGLCIEMGSLDEAVRTKILEMRVSAAKAAQQGFEVSPAVIAYVAQTLATNGRDLEGAVNRLMAHATLTGSPLTLETAEIAIRDLVRTREPKRPKIEDIQKLVASHYNVTRADILSSRRTANVVLPRQIAMYLSKTVTMRSLPEIGRRFGGRDHTTVLHAVRKIDGLTKNNLSLGEEVELLKRTLLE